MPLHLVPRGSQEPTRKASEPARQALELTKQASRTNSTGLRPLSEQLKPKELYKEGQGYRWPYDASRRLVISVLGLKKRKTVSFFKQRELGDTDVQFWHYAEKSRLRRSHRPIDHKSYGKVSLETYANPRKNRTRRKRLRIKWRTDRQGQTDRIMGINPTVSWE